MTDPGPPAGRHRPDAARVVLAPDKFKGSLTAAEVVAALDRGIRTVRPDVETVAVPVADGGDGTVAAALAAGYRRVAVTASGPTGEPVATAYARRGDTAVVEMASVSGLAQLPGGRLRALEASSRGTGEVLAAAVAAGCRHVVLGVGGSASTDGGAGLVQALGGRVLDSGGREVSPGGAGLAAVERVDLAGVRSALAGVDIVLASDVDNPLTGPDGAAAVYGPQKGATEPDARRLDAALARWADAVAVAVGADLRDRAGAGAAGGVGFAAMAALGARMRPGIDVVLDLVGFDAVIGGAMAVVVGEGSLDDQSLAGKAPVGVARRARAAGVPVLAVCGRLAVSGEQLRAAGIDRVVALSELEPDPAVCLARAGHLVEQAGRRLAAGLPDDTSPRET